MQELADPGEIYRQLAHIRRALDRLISHETTREPDREKLVAVRLLLNCAQDQLCADHIGLRWQYAQSA